MAFHTTTLINTVPTQAVKAAQVRRKDAAAVLAFASFGLVVIAAVLVTVHPMELKSKSDTALFESALKSQQADLAKQKAGEQKLKSVVETSIAHEDGREKQNLALTRDWRTVDFARRFLRNGAGGRRFPALHFLAGLCAAGRPPEAERSR